MLKNLGTVLSVALLCTLPLKAHASEAFELVTPGEYAEAVTAGENPAHDLMPKALPGGPQINVISPVISGGSLGSPVDIEVKFIAGQDASIDMQSLRIFYLMFVKKDVTERIMEHAEVGADFVRAPGAKLPAGKHKFLLEISDSKNRKSTQKIVVEVKA